MPIVTVERSIASHIVLSNGRCFPVLCALDSNAQGLADPRIVSMFGRLSAVIAMQIDQLTLRNREKSAIRDERAVRHLRKQFVAILGHDLRDPLQAIFITSDSLIRKSVDPSVPTIASRIKAQARRMSLLVTDLLDFARATLGGGVEVDLGEVADINNWLAIVVQEIKDAQPDCEIIASIELCGVVRCDLGKIQQLASNLLGNALMHGAPRSPITIAAHADESDFTS